MQYFKKLLLFLSSILLIGIIYFGIALIEKGKQAKIYKSDYAILHSTEFGMFNSDLWTLKVTNIIDKKIDTFNLNADNRNEIKGYIESIIDTLIIEADRVVRERNKGKRGFFDSILGSTKQMITDSLLDIKALRKRVPEFTNAVILEVEKPENQARAKTLLREKLKEFMHQKFQTVTDMSQYKNVLKKYNSKDLKSCNSILDIKMSTLSSEMNGLMYIILSLAGVLILFILLHGTLNTIALFLLSGTTVSLLITGVLLPMLDIEAKITKLYFTILDQTIIFENQILFFQSKSIYDLVRLLFESGEARMILVAVLLVMFSIIFPTLKLIATTMYYYSTSIIGNNPITRFFALYSTKWSMADVMVVSIFMAYLGLDGVVNNELKSLESSQTPINIITTNGTHLEVGFFLFLGFVLSSFVLSILVGKSKKIKHT